MAERRPDLAREHRLHDRFRGPPRASPVRFQVSRPADRTSRGWARGVPLAECRFPGPATRRLGRLRRESERSTAPGICAPLRENLWWCVVVVVVAATPNYLRQASQNLGKYSGRIGAAAIPSAGGAVHADRSSRPSLPYTPSYEVCPACPVPRTRFGHHLPYTTPPLPYYHPRAPTPTSPVSDAALYHAMLWYTPSMRTRVPSFGQTFPNKVGPCQNTFSCRRSGVSSAGSAAPQTSLSRRPSQPTGPARLACGS